MAGTSSSRPSSPLASISGLGNDVEKRDCANNDTHRRDDDIESKTGDDTAGFSSGSVSDSEKRARKGEGEEEDGGETGGEGEVASITPGRDAETGSITGRVLSRISTRSSFNPGPPPDGGTKAWLVGELRSHERKS